MKGTMISETLAIRWMPPMMTRAAQTVTMRPTTMVVTVISTAASPEPMVKTTWALSGSKKFWAAEVMPLIWVMVPIPRAPARTAKRENSLPIHFQLLPMPFSM